MLYPFYILHYTHYIPLYNTSSPRLRRCWQGRKLGGGNAGVKFLGGGMARDCMWEKMCEEIVREKGNSSGEKRAGNVQIPMQDYTSLYVQRS